MLNRSARMDADVRAALEDGRYEDVAVPLPMLLGCGVDVKPALPEGAVRSPMVPCNPSVCIHKSRRFAIVRAVSYRLTAKGHRGSGVFATDNHLVEYDASWNAVSSVKCNDADLELDRGHVRGIEDCRLFSRGDKLFASGTIAQGRSKIRCNDLLREVMLAKVTERDCGREAVLEHRGVMVGPWSPYHQKNWRPVCDDVGPMRWIYSSDPLVVVTPTQDESGPDDLKWYLTSPWAGSSQAVRVPGGWLWVDHHRVPLLVGVSSVYLHRFTLADESLTRIVATSKPFVFGHFGIEFCAGLAIDRERAVLSYGVWDSMALIATTSLDAVMRSLKPVVPDADA